MTSEKQKILEEWIESLENDRNDIDVQINAFRQALDIMSGAKVEEIVSSKAQDYEPGHMWNRSPLKNPRKSSKGMSRTQYNEPVRDLVKRYVDNHLDTSEVPITPHTDWNLVNDYNNTNIQYESVSPRMYEYLRELVADGVLRPIRVQGENRKIRSYVKA